MRSYSTQKVGRPNSVVGFPLTSVGEVSEGIESNGADTFPSACPRTADYNMALFIMKPMGKYAHGLWHHH